MLFDLVVPTIGRASLRTLLSSLDGGGDPFPDRVLLVDDRAGASAPLRLPGLSSAFRSRIEIHRSGGNGPAAARNVGWRAASAPWVAFLDDDVVPPAGWTAELVADLRSAPPDVAASQGNVRVPLPPDRQPTDWERNVLRLEGAPWITADMAVRREAMLRAGGFDERFRRAFREDSDLALRLRAAGYRVAFGARTVKHPVRPADRWVSVRLQAGNADDVLMAALHGPRWEHASRGGRRPIHVLTVSAFLVAAAASAAREWPAAALAAGGWLALTARFAWTRIAPGPRTADEALTMIATSVAIPFAAVGWWLVGLARLRRRLGDRVRAPSATAADDVRLAA